MRHLLQYSSMMEVLVNSVKHLFRKFFTPFPNLMFGGDQIILYLQCIVFVNLLGFYCDIGNSSCCSFDVCLIWSFSKRYVFIFIIIITEVPQVFWTNSLEELLEVPNFPLSQINFKSQACHHMSLLINVINRQDHTKRVKDER